MSPAFTLIYQTTHPYLQLCKFIKSIQDLIIENSYKYVLIGKFQSDSIERQLSEYRQISGEGFLVSLRKVNTSEKISILTHVLKENLNFWEKDIQAQNTQISEFVSKVKEKASYLSTEILETQPNDDSKQVAVMIAGYMVKKLSKGRAYVVKMIKSESNIEYDECLRTLSRED